MDELNIGDIVADGQTLTWYEKPNQKTVMTRYGNTVHIHHEFYGLEALFDANAEAAANFNATGSHGDMERVASIPIGLWSEWNREGITDDPAAYARRLNDSDYRKFRVNSWTL